ncbi:MAG TPA: hypothetical protein VHK06_01190 [Candidatus Limnocylindria bacterium]|nr:hypothetical protein [Candidatus Limnocylindria bacterium]
MSKNEARIEQEDVWKEHLDNVSVPAHWAYLLGVIIGAFLLMVALVALLGASGG